jgi:hypothetical protein
MPKTINKKGATRLVHGETPSDRETCISTKAYYMAEARGFKPGHEQNDWLAAELAVDAKVPGE